MTDHTPITPPTSDPARPQAAVDEQSMARPSSPAAHRASSTAAWIVSLALAAVVGALLFASGFLVGGAGRGSCTTPSGAFAPLCEAYQKLKDEYVDKLDDTALAEGAIQGMFQYGVKDPFSGYMPPQQYEQALGDLSGKFEGIGAEMALKNTTSPGDLAACQALSDTCVLVVVAPISGSPAEKAGLRAGDIVRAVDGASVNGSTVSDQVTKVRGKAGTTVTLTIERDGKTFDQPITRGEITMREVESRMLDNGVGYIALHGFSTSSPDQFHTDLKALVDGGARSIVFDLRDNPGGYIDAARKIASEFVSSGLIFTQESNGNLTRWEALDGYGVATDPKLPVAVLINNGSASASEIVSAALKELGRATIIGQHSFGKNTVQVWAPLENDGGVRITISRWFTPKHNSVHPDGVQPDITVEIPKDAQPDQDVVLQRAVEELSKRAIGEESSPGASPVSTSSAAPAASDATSYDPSGRTTVTV
jgi:carboxyl-terminal processing protease